MRLREQVEGPCRERRASRTARSSRSTASTAPSGPTALYGDPTRLAASPTATAAARVVATKVHRLAGAGRLRTSEERATQLLLAAGCGTALTLVGVPAQDRDASLSAAAREACIVAVTTDSSSPAVGGRVGAAVALRADLVAIDDLSAGEKTLLGEWLDRIVERGDRPGRGG